MNDPRPSATGPFLFAALLALCGVAVADPDQAPVVDHPTLLADGPQETEIEVPTVGRYALMVHSLQGAGLQVIDKMTGPGPRAGHAGGEDGRIDLFLDRGRYKLRVDAVKDGKGEVRVEARPFEELHAQPFPVMPELRVLEATLDDLEQRSWWLDTRSGARPALEVAGRNLHDLRIWRDGSWLVDALPSCQEVAPLEGKPLYRCTLSPALEPGLYLLVAYGGPDRPWSEDEDQHPLYLRSGIPELPEAGRMTAAVSPMGVDRYLVPKGPEYFRVELPKPEPASLSVREYNASNPFEAGGRSARIEDESRLPVAEVNSSSRGQQVVNVSGEPGQPYVLQHFNAIRDTARVDPKAESWVATVHGGFAGDSIDATSILVWRPDQGSSSVSAADVIALDKERGWARRFNLLKPASLFVEVKVGGDYELRSTGTAARFRIEPFFTSRPSNYKTPDWRYGEKVEWELDPGYYVLSMEPVDPGIAQVQLGWDGWISSALDAVGMDPGIDPDPVRAGTQYPSVKPRASGHHVLYLSQQPEVQAGLIERALPLDLEDALPLSLRPGDEPVLTAKFPERGRLVAVTDDGTPLKISIDGGEAAAGQAVKPGQRTVKVLNPGEDTIIASLRFFPRSKRPDAPLVPIAQVDLDSIPEFAELTSRAPEFFDLAAQSGMTWKVRVDEPGLYTLASTGLLATEGNLRTRINPSARRVSENGVGRNFRVAEYLREGDYQLTVSTRGYSAGHLGLELARSPMTQGGALSDGVPARAALAAGEGLVYTFTVPEEGRYRVRAFGQQGSARCRLEDADGWPVIAPGVACQLDETLRAGDYRLVVLPSDVEGRRITEVERFVPEPWFDGPGPHAVELEQLVRGTWTEPPKGEERPPQVYTFSLPAPARLNVALSGEMVAELFNASGERVGRKVPNQAWYEELPAGDYELRVVNGRRDNGVDYTLSLSPQQLLEGMRRGVGAPARVPVSVGREGLVEISSRGGADVRAELYDAHGRLISKSDDRPQDWNFRVVARLDPGEYSLRVEPVGERSASTELRMRAPPEVVQPEMRLPMVLSMQPGDGVQLIPLSLKPEDELIAVRARSAESVGVALEAQVGGRWVTASQQTGPETTQILRLGGEAQAWRLRVWSLDLRGNPVELRADRVKPDTTREAGISRGQTLRGGSRSLPGVAAVKASLNRPGVFEVPATEGLLWCPEPAAACEPVLDPALPVGSDTLWLAGVFEDSLRAEASRASLSEQAARVRLYREAPVAVDLTGEGGPVVALARASFGQPGARIVQGTEVRAPEAGRQGVALGDRAALAVSLSGSDPALVLWPAGGLPTGGMELSLQQRAFEAVEAEAADWGSVDLELAPGEARAFKLPGRAAARLVIDDGLVAVLSKGERIVSVRWADGGLLEEELLGAEGRLTLLHPGFVNTPARAQLTLRPGEAAPLPIAYGDTVERRLLRPGLTRVQVAPGEPDDLLHLRGDVRAARYLSEAGAVYVGQDLPVGAGGELLIEHDAGLLLAWFSRGSLSGEGLWGQQGPGPAQDVVLPALVALEGPVRSLRVDMPEAGLLSLRAPAAMIVGHVTPSGVEQVHGLPDSGVLDLWLPAGANELRLRGVAGVPLWGALELTASAPTPIGEGLGPELLLGAGASRVFSFTVPREGKVGYGVRASAERVVAALLDAEGQPVSAGALGMAKLSPGAYLLVLHLPADADPVRVRPALVGVEPPDTGPPEEVVREYVPRRGGE
ncbi:MAG: hypothetical protein H6740_12520 [Alphaproteobacteria bacterium]|nr:hypothetical protein [Alphaproteobacteria bacterium]